MNIRSRCAGETLERGGVLRWHIDSGNIGGSDDSYDSADEAVAAAAVVPPTARGTSAIMFRTWRGREGERGRLWLSKLEMRPKTDRERTIGILNSGLGAM